MGNANVYKQQQKDVESQIPVEGHYVSDFKTGQRWATAPIESDETVKKVPFGQTIPKFEDNQFIKDLNIKDMYMPSSYYKPKAPGQIWGPYKKQFTKSSFGQNLFTPPESVDGIPILCRCRDIKEYVTDKDGGITLNALYALLAGDTPPACWEDNEMITDPFGSMYFFIVIRHPDFYNYAQSKHGAQGVLMNQFTQPRITGFIPSVFAAKAATSKNAKPGDVLSAGITVLRSFTGGSSRRNKRAKARAKRTRKNLR